MGKDGMAGYIAFGRRIRCFIDRDLYDRDGERLRAAVAGKAALTVKGRVVGLRGDALVLVDSIFTLPER